MKNNQNLASGRKNERGYNLFMTSISLMVVGIIAVGFINIYSLYKKNDEVVTNQARITNIMSVIQNYKNRFGHFPCPSSLNAPRTSVLYGAENCTTPIPAGSCTGGLCVINGRSIAGVPQPVRIGSVPFRLLQIDEKETIDAYGSRFVYAVTQKQTSVTDFNELIGAIDIGDESGQSVADDPNGLIPGTVAFALVSHGPNKYGAFNLNGTQPIPCAAGISEAKNCINFALPPATPYKLMSSLAYLAGGATTFDDSVEYFSSSTPSRWRRTDGNDESIQTLSNNNVGVGISTPVVALDISQSLAQPAIKGKQASITGALQAQPSIAADRICDYGGVNCFQTSDFTTASSTYMNCNTASSKKYMIGIGPDSTGKHAQAMCGYLKTACPTGQVLIGFTGTTPKCTVIGTGCSESTVQICDSSTPRIFDIRNSNVGKSNPISTKCINGVNCTNIGTGVNQQYYNIYDPTSYPASYAQAQFRCNAGNWERTGVKSGLCSCDPTPPPNSNCLKTPLSPACSAPTACPGLGTGTASIKYTYDATACKWNVSTTDYSACVCPATPIGSAPTSNPCSGSGNNGNTWAWNNSKSVCNWQSSCTCTAPSPATRTLTSGVSCSTPTPTGPGLVGYNGTAYKKQAFNSTLGTCTWADTGWDTTGCTCDTSGAPFKEVKTGTCDTACESETTPAYNWYVYDMVAGACVKKFDHDTPSACAPKTFSWKINATQVPTRGQDSYGRSPPIGERCNQSCSTNNKVGSGSACWQAGENGKYDIFSCLCLQN